MCICAAVLPRPPASPSPAAPGSAERSFTCAHPSAADPLAYPPSSAAPVHVFLLFSAALLGPAFAPPSAAGSGPSAERSIGAQTVPHSLARAFPGLPRVFIPGSRGSPARLSKKKRKWNDYLAFFMFVLLTLISQYISEIVLFC